MPCASAEDRARSRSPGERLGLAGQHLLELDQRLLGLLGRGRLAVKAEGALHQRDAAALLRLAHDRRGPLPLAAPLERLHDRVHVVTVDLDRVHSNASNFFRTSRRSITSSVVPSVWRWL